MWDPQIGIPHQGDEFRSELNTLAEAFDYELGDLIGQGANGAVYRACHKPTTVEVALKRLKRMEPEAVYRLKQEFQVLCDVHHASLVHMYELVADDSGCFFTMELVDGPGLIEWTRQGQVAGQADSALVGRTCQALAQLCGALSVVHGSGRVHRDVKPGNVRVCKDGRIVLLDFGLMAVLGRSRDVAGTAAYMAPEAIWSLEAGPKADVYSLGVLAYECLAGQRLFPPVDLIQLDRLKRKPLRDLPSGVPVWLSDLLARMTHRDASLRPTVLEVRHTVWEYSGARGTEVRHATPLVGREQSISTLATAYRGRDRATPTLVQVVGSSGIGKTHLVRSFCDHLDTDPNTFVLRGRCLPIATVPLPGLDGVVDAISQELCQLPGDQVSNCIPPNPADLVDVFPVFGRVKSFRSMRSEASAPDPRERRRRAFDALRLVLRALAKLRDVVVWLDDVQWSDRDSLRFWSETFSRGLPVFFIATSRDTKAQQLLSQDFGRGTCVQIQLDGLSEAEVHLLVAHFAHDAPSPETTSWIAKESGGNPFLALQFAHHLASIGGSEGLEGEQTLMRVLRARLSGKHGETLRLLELACVSTKPLALRTLSRAGDLRASGQAMQELLREGQLIERVALSPDMLVVPYHDRIRDALLKSLPDDVLRSHHRCLAEELTQTNDADPTATFWHWRGSGDQGMARTYAVKAGDKLMGALAFDQAIEVYKLALATKPQDHDDLWRLHEKLGAAHEAAGEGRLAGENYQSAAEALNDDPTLQFKGRQLLQRSADAFLRSGYLEQGYRNLGRVLPQLRGNMPTSNLGLVLFTMRKRTSTILKNAVLPTLECTASRAAELDALMTATVGLVWADNARSTFFQAHYASKALRTDNAIHRTRALSTESCYLAAPGFRILRRRAHKLADESLTMAREIGDPNLLAFVYSTIGATSFLSGRWKQAVERCHGGVELIKSDCVGAGWELSSAYVFYSSALSMMGDIAAIETLRPQVVEHARSCGDLLASTCVRVGLPNVTWLARGQPDVARKMADEALSQWSSFAYSPLDFFGAIGAMQVDLFEGSARDARQRFINEAERIEGSLLIHNQVIRALLRYFDGSTALAAFTKTSSRAEREHLASLAASASKKLCRESVPWCRALGDSLRAGVLWSEGQTDPCLQMLERAQAVFDAADMTLFMQSARFHAQRLRGHAPTAFPAGVVAPHLLAQALMPIAYGER